MKIKRQNHSLFFKGLVLVVAFALTVLCFPVNELVALAAEGMSTRMTEEYNYITLGQDGESISTVVRRGKTYTVPNAYIGGNTSLVVGEVKNASVGSVTVQTSSVTVRYGSSEGAVVTASTEDGWTGQFEADKVGTYVITYSYDYNDGDNTYTNSYDLTITSETSNASINFNNNSKYFIPSIIDLSLAKEGESYKNLYIPVSAIKDENGEEVEDLKVVSSLPAKEDREGNFVVVSVRGGDSSAVELKSEGEKLYVSGDTFKTKGAGKYTFTYRYYIDGEFITSTTKTTTVYAEGATEEENYYQGYKLKLELASDFPSTAQTGVESTLPAAIGKVADSAKTHAGEAVDVHYTVKVRYMAPNSNGGYVDLKTKAALYNTDVENPVMDEDGNLVDPTKFKPLEDGWYTFIYTITDFYGKTVSSTETVYEFKNIKDEQAPTPILYDAATVERDSNKKVKEYVDESHKFATNANANGVVVYAIGMTDNVSKVGDEGVELTRKIMTSETDEKLVIEHYDEYNLVFNYRKTSESNSAWSNFMTNNYLVRKAIGATSITSDKEMLDWMKENYYLIAVDNANVNHIYDLFKTTGAFGTENFAKAEDFKTWLQEQNKTEEGRKKIAAMGFAYFDCNETFGQMRSEASTGMGVGQYYVHYIAKDAAGRTRDLSKGIYIGTYTDDEAPVIKFSTTLAETYLPDAVITFDAPTATDNNGDRNMLVRTAYRYLDKDGNVIPFKDEDGNVIASDKLLDLKELYKDINDNEIWVDGEKPTEKYKDFHNAEPEDASQYVPDGYKEITDKSANSYTIKLKEAPTMLSGEKTVEAAKLQIFVFVYDDWGNANIYAETIEIERTVDNKSPVFKNVKEKIEDKYLQGAEIVLPTLEVTDDGVSNMTYDVKVTHIDIDKKEFNVDVTGDYAERNVTSLSGFGSYTIYGGKFVASYDGIYRVTITATDSNNNSVTYFKNYVVGEREAYWQKPVINVSMENKTVELDDNPAIEIPTPSVSYSIPSSVTYDKFVASTDSDTEFADKKYVVLGVDENNKATKMGWSVSCSVDKNGTFRPNKVGVTNIVYTVKMTAYDFKTFAYVDQDGQNGGFFKYKSGHAGVQVYCVADDEFMFVSSGASDGIFAKKTETGFVFTNEEGNTVSSLPSDVTNQMIEEWFEGIKHYVLKSDTFRCEVQDTKGPVITDYDYEKVMSAEELKAKIDSKEYIDIYAIEATDRSGINWDRSKVAVTWKPVDTKSGEGTTREFSGKEDVKFSDFKNVMDGSIRIVYTVYDNNNRYTTAEYTITVGDNEAPVLSFKDDFVKDSYEIGQELKIDLTKITATDKNLDEDYKKVVTLKDSNGKEVDIKSETTDMLVFKLDNVGNYTLTVEVTDKVGNKATRDFTIEVAAKTQDTTMTYQVVGTILIVISVLVLAGVIVYFIVSKVKLDKELKK